jgi:hypothetical protein
MTRRFVVALALVAACDSSSKTKPPVEAKPAAPAPPSGSHDERTPGAYTVVANKGPFDVVLGRGEGPVVIDAPADWMARVETTVEAGVLEIDLVDGSPTTVPPIRVTVPSEKVDDVMLLGTGAVYGAVPLLGKKVTLSIAGGGTMQVDTSADGVAIQITGSGSMKLTGTTGRLDAALSGAGSLDAAGLSAKDAAVQNTGSGSVELNVISTLTCDNTGSGTLRYSGGAATDASRCRNTGSGSVERRKF